MRRPRRTSDAISVRVAWDVEITFSAGDPRLLPGPESAAALGTRDLSAENDRLADLKGSTRNQREGELRLDG
ncbi:hypothetical protein ACH61_00305 [Rathayibacter tanaceti]|uniref:Uncharacterized protein n=1 Tax=Rathayibacter tanaceti TaxID=1671680 RepID=A0A162GK55_9MICO|nr:hypothetical protein ACH61_00305 [Rathayibacter tanaceti]